MRKRPRKHRPIKRSKPKPRSTRRSKPIRKPVRRSKPIRKPVRRTKPIRKPVRRSKPTRKPIRRTKPTRKPVRRTKPTRKPDRRSKTRYRSQGKEYRSAYRKARKRFGKLGRTWNKNRQGSIYSRFEIDSIIFSVENQRFDFYGDTASIQYLLDFARERVPDSYGYYFSFKGSARQLKGHKSFPTGGKAPLRPLNEFDETTLDQDLMSLNDIVWKMSEYEIITEARVRLVVRT